MPEQSHPLGAVFISYCSQDAPAAERICDALRAVGIDVWLDKNELRGGDAWDAQIRKRIHDCALFIPVISANTNARNEGYFRREWKQAIRRLEDLADDVAFLVPVVIDETTEADARVPEEFLRAHWVWLPAGDVPAAFPQRVRQLLGQDHAVVSARGPTATGAIEPGARAAGASGHRGAPFLRRFGLPLIALLLAVIGGLTWYYVGGREIPAAKSAVTAVQAAPNDKSIAVLPFVNMSPDPEQEYFSDGVSEQILNLLSKIPELRVIARTSSFAFKGKEDTDVASIARALNVSHILEGSVQKSANRVRINAQLINAADSSRQWSESYERELTEVFALQDEIALEVVHQLEVVLQGDALPEQSSTTSLKAYNLYLRGRHLADQHTAQSLSKAAEYFDQALQVDLNYAEAWAALALVRATLTGEAAAEAQSSFRVGYESARDAAQKALEIDGGLGRAHLALAFVQHQIDWD